MWRYPLALRWGSRSAGGPWCFVFGRRQFEIVRPTIILCLIVSWKLIVCISDNFFIENLENFIQCDRSPFDWVCGSINGRSYGRGRTCPPVFLSLFERYVSLCERVDFSMHYMRQFRTRDASFHLLTLLSSIAMRISFSRSFVKFCLWLGDNSSPCRIRRSFSLGTSKEIHYHYKQRKLSYHVWQCPFSTFGCWIVQKPPPRIQCSRTYVGQKWDPCWRGQTPSTLDVNCEGLCKLQTHRNDWIITEKRLRISFGSIWVTTVTVQQVIRGVALNEEAFFPCFFFYKKFEHYMLEDCDVRDDWKSRSLFILLWKVCEAFLSQSSLGISTSHLMCLHVFCDSVSTR